MSIRLQEMHPSLVHFPVALLPLSIGADLIGHLTGSRGLLGFGRRTVAIAAAGAAVSALTGLVAQEEVNVEGKTMDMLITHRNINLAATVATGLMAAWRVQRDRPTLAYLGAGLAGVAALTYSAYLGGTLVYQYGVGIAPAGGQWRPDAPELGEKGETSAFAKDTATDLAHGVKHLAQELAKGQIVPSLTDGWRGRAPAPQAAADAAAAPSSTTG
ncbi:MAG TPA: DUF2231 domain-containing protein [Gemmatimonadaceae bacterium]|nr:DUF2231 domain-containing protein [Gemmatimonadaceae bacterium]